MVWSSPHPLEISIFLLQTNFCNFISLWYHLIIICPCGHFLSFSSLVFPLMYLLPLSNWFLLFSSFLYRSIWFGFGFSCTKQTKPNQNFGNCNNQWWKWGKEKNLKVKWHGPKEIHAFSTTNLNFGKKPEFRHYLKSFITVNRRMNILTTMIMPVVTSFNIVQQVLIGRDGICQTGH